MKQEVGIFSTDDESFGHIHETFHGLEDTLQDMFNEDKSPFENIPFGVHLHHIWGGTT